MKVFKLVMQIVMIASIITIAYLCGIYSTKYSQIQKENKSTIMTIAVVNADAGVMVEGEKKYYSSELMLFPDANFKSVSLTEAEEGVACGRYAAYILIPENFSKSIESVNGEPVKTQISYALYDNLRQDVEIKVVNDIHNFILNLSTNVSYVYVDAILQEIHAVQDDSQMIMQNDVRDREAIEEVQSANLIAEVEYEPLEAAETELEYMDLSTTYEILEQTILTIDTTYTDAVTSAEEEFAVVKESGMTVDEQASETANVFTEVDILTDAEGNCVYESGMEKLGSVADDFDEIFDEKKMTAKERLGFKEGDKEPEPEPELPEGEERIYLSKDDLLKEVDRQISYMEAVKNCLPPTVSIASESDEKEDEEKEEEENYIYELSQKGAGEAIEDLNAFKADIDKYYQNAIRAINEIPDASEIASSSQQIIHEEIEAPLMEEIVQEAGNVTASLDTMLETLDTYITTIDEYDAMSYLDSEAIMEYQDSLHDTIYDLEKEIMEQDDKYLAYIDEVEEVARNNTEMLQESLDTSYEQTNGTIEEVMAGFQENRKTLNEINVSLLEDITKKLPYTRLGSLKYTQVYDFIVQPVVSNDKSAYKVEINPTSIYMEKMDLIRLCVGVTALVTLYVSVLMIHRRFTHAKEKGEEGELWQAE